MLVAERSQVKTELLFRTLLDRGFELLPQLGRLVFDLLLHSLVNIYSSPLVAMFNNVSVGWHVLGVAVIIGILIG